MSARRQSSRWRVPSFLGISLLGHAFLILFVMVSGVFRACEPIDFAELQRPPGGPNAPDNEPIDVTMIEPTPLNPLERPRTEEEEERAALMELEQARKPEEDPEAHGQVVEIPKPAVEVRPDDAAFLSEYDSKVDKQTKAPARAPGDVGASSPAVATPPRPPVEAPRERVERPKSDGERGNGVLAMRTRGSGDERPRPRGEAGGLEPLDPDGVSPKRDETGAGDTDDPAGTEVGKGGAPGEPGDGEESPGMDELRPSEDSLARVVGEGSSDYLADVDEGAQDLLSTKRWKYASFFNRVKRAVAQNWHPDTAYRLRDPTGQIYGHKNRLTILKVSIHPDGKIRDILIEKPCGVDFLDDEAISAMRGAEPFPNPPAGLIDKDSKLITFRFGFFFEISSAPSFRIFRYSN